MARYSRRFFCLTAALGVLMLMLFCLSGCQGNGSGLLGGYRLEEPSSIQSAKLQYMNESLGIEYVYVAYESGDDARLQAILGALLDAREVQMPVDFAFNAPLNASHRLELIMSDGQIVEVFYDVRENLFIFIGSDDNIENRLTYHYLRPNETESMADMLAGQRSAAINPNDTKKPVIDPSSLVLRASIEPEELTKEGAEVEFSVYGGVFIHNEEKPYYQVLTKDTLPPGITDVGEDAYLIVAAMGKPEKEGVLIDIESIISTDRYMKITVNTIPAIDETAVQDYPTAAVTVAKLDFPADKIIVFVDADNNILEAQQLK